MKRILSAALFLIVFADNANAATTTFNCAYQKEASPDGIERLKKPFALDFIIDHETKKAYMLGNNGSSEVQLIRSEKGTTFIEITGAGNVMTTTIDAKLVTVHSRNTVLFGDLLPTQYYGTCVRK